MQASKANFIVKKISSSPQKCVLHNLHPLPYYLHYYMCYTPDFFRFYLLLTNEYFLLPIQVNIAFMTSVVYTLVRKLKSSAVAESKQYK